MMQVWVRARDVNIARITFAMGATGPGLRTCIRQTLFRLFPGEDLGPLA
jgi:hypothetical protein